MNPNFLRSCLVLCLASLACYGRVGAAESPDFERQILPLLYNRCFSCHSEKVAKPKAELRLDSAEGIRQSGVLNTASPDKSELLIRVSLPHSDEGLMPPLKGGGQPLSEAERGLVRRWIATGANMQGWQRFNHREPAVEFRNAPLSRADVPELARKVDELVQQYHLSKGTALNAAVSDEGFLRRVYLDVAGRIPSYAESQEYLASKVPDKRARLIDKLLDGEGYVSHTFNWKADQLRLVTKGFPGQPGYMYEDWVKESIQSGMAYDEFVRQLVTAQGYLWENGAVGFYLRDLGMPFDHMSNMARIFLGTRLECAQCHDHPFEPITQKDFYQLTAYTYGVSNLYSSAGFSPDNVKQWPELKSLLDSNNASKALRDAASGTIAPLKRLTKDTEHSLTFPEHYASEPVARGKVVEARTMFGDEAPATAENRRVKFADWITSPRNPRFTRNIVNRLFKRVMGVGLIEPVDSLSPVNRPEQPELLEFLTQTMAQLRYDERAFLAVLLNSRVYQSEAERKDLEPGEVYMLRGPLARRLSAEQVWDSLLVLLVEDLDSRKPLPLDRGPAGRDLLVKLTNMTAEELLKRSHEMAEYHAVRRRHNIELENQKSLLKKATESGDAEKVRQLRAEYATTNAQFEQLQRSMQMGGLATAKETDPRWQKLPPSLVRASEIPTPISLGHFLRQFGQSDRREIDAFNKSPKITHSLALMNGDLTQTAIESDSYLQKELNSIQNAEQRIDAIYQSILIRRPNAEEAERCRELFATSRTPDADLIWALLNSPEFLFIQ
ncbi:Planctomycete cytochrome C [Anatilimnocola aggregata]|uniref:Planctomycete cytochrome C n=1 Tax=Anatilimnocola aggregata TaxID=2528021 RepID=A0A517YN68_9BACT|nr:DUF1549 domain-containing protein [Anatilimnocola aggregata]QDU31661.1 Planctomycete cytochrome C [Anatilimnocola aggregata]